MSEEFEGAIPRGRRPPPPQRPGRRPPPRPRRPVVRPLYLGPIQPGADREPCEVLLVLEGYAPGGRGIESHHEPMLRRLTDALRRMGRRAGMVEVVALARSPARGDEGDGRTDAVVRRLRELLPQGPPFRRLARVTAGPPRVEIRVCME